MSKNSKIPGARPDGKTNENEFARAAPFNKSLRLPLNHRVSLIGVIMRESRGNKRLVFCGELTSVPGVGRGRC